MAIFRFASTPPSGDGPFPCLVYFHGGGWVIGDLEMVNAACRTLAARAKCVVVSVDYRLAPEHKYPVSIRRLLRGDQVGCRPRRLNLASTAPVIAVGGDSAGGNLAAAVSLRARDEGGPALVDAAAHLSGDRPPLRHRLLCEQWRELPADHRHDEWFWDHYLNSDADGELAYVSPLRADDLSNLPPATVVTAEFDPLRDEGEAYASKPRRRWGHRQSHTVRWPDSRLLLDASRIRGSRNCD